VATSFTVKARIIDGTYDFDHFYFTESDQACASASLSPPPSLTLSMQILMMRNPIQLFDILRQFPRYVLLPHRLIPYPDAVSHSALESVLSLILLL
jgi:hypothetical protein